MAEDKKKTDAKATGKELAKKEKGKGKDKGDDTRPYKPVDWKDPKLIAEMAVAAIIIVTFMAISGGLSTFGLQL